MLKSFVFVRPEDEFPAFEVKASSAAGRTEFIFESVEADGDETVAFAESSTRFRGITAALEWVSAGDFTFQALDDLAYGLADLDEDGEVTEEEEDEYNAILAAAGDALVFLGGNAKNVSALLDEDDDAGLKLGTMLTDKLDNTEEDDDEIILRFAMPKGMITEAVAKVVRNGKVVFVRKKLKRKRISAAQRAALKKARRKSNSAAARFARKKSMKLRKSRNM